MSRTSRALVGLLVPALLLGTWELVARLGLISQYLLPPVSSVMESIWQMAKDGTLARDLEASFIRVYVGFGLGSAIGFALGLATGLSATTERLLDPTLQAIRSIPALAWVPILLLWMGIDEAPKITLVAVGAFFPVYLGVVSGLRGVDRKLIEVGHVYGMGTAERIRRIILPASLPSIMTGLRTAMGVAWLYVVAAEMIAASSGLGFMLTDGRELSRGDLIFSAILLLALCGKLSDGLLKLIEARLLAWRDADQTDVTTGGIARG